jgi:DNA polymerase III alpha subunit
MYEELYVELRAHSAFSFGDGSATPEALVAAAASLGYPAIGLTDATDFGGVVRFALASWEAGITPLIGCEIIVDGSPAAFLARSAEGCRNLAALITLARSGCLRDWPPAATTEGTGERTVERRPLLPPRGRPHVRWADVVSRSAGLQAFTGPASGALANCIRRGDLPAAARHLAEWRAVFGEHLAVEVQLHHAGRADAALAGALIELAEREGVPWVATNNPRYVSDEGRLVHDVLTALRAGVDLDTGTTRGLLHPNDTWRLRAPAEMAALWRGREEGLAASVRIADRCRGFTLDWLRPPMPT